MEAPSPIEILKYWLTCIRYEEAAAARPKAARLQEEQAKNINLSNPASDRMYFKIPLHDAAMLLEGRGALTLPVQGEVAEFFEAWLAKQYRSDKSDEGPEIMVMCPTAYFSSGELAGLIRFQVSVDFVHENGSRFEIPSRSQRRKGAALLPPALIRIERVEREEGPPFFVDPRLMTLELGILPEELDAVFGAWRDLDLQARPVVEYLRELLALIGGTCQTDSADELLRQATDAMSICAGLLPNAPGCYPIALVLDASRARPTFHLQRELETLLRNGVSRKDNGILWSYLTRTPMESLSAPLFGLFADLPITASQKRAVSHFIGSRFTAVEGPPGCGKTSVILHLAAHKLVDRIARFVKTGIMPRDIAVVCSTNNRAVDNVIDRLATDAIESPIALGFRTGNRRVCETVSVAVLQDALNALKGEPGREEENLERLRKTKRHFKDLHRKLSDLLRPQIERKNALLEKRRLEGERASLLQIIGEDQGETLPTINAMKSATALLLRLESELIQLCDKCQGRPTAKKRNSVERFYENVISGLLDRTHQALEKLRIHVKVFTPPKIKNVDHFTALSHWEDSAEIGIDAIEPIGQAVGKMRARKEAVDALGVVSNKLAALHVPDEISIDEVEADGIRHELFHAAREVRSAFASLHADKYVEALKYALGFLGSTSSLRRMKAEAQERLKELFPIWGCTLLSLGNVFDDDAEAIDEVVIDEAGQCHPAYAVSALCRARRALILGDVHQLTPVYSLSEAEERPILYGVIKEKSGRPRSIRDFRFRAFDKSKASVQETAEASVSEVLRLTDHFRCQKEIIEISNRLCGHHLTVHTPLRSRQDLVPFLSAPVIRIDVHGEAERLGGSRFNQAEVREVSGLLESMLSLGISPEEIAVITPYRAQLLHFRRAFAAKRFPMEESAELIEDRNMNLFGSRDSSGIALGTVHRFQGGERSIVLFSTVVTDESHLKFLDERVNLINVAASRAMDHLLIIGDFETLNKGRFTRELAQPIASRI